MSAWLRRWRHSRGFGVHSPSAFRLIREVLRPSRRYVFYAYAEIAEMSSDKEEYAELSLIFRLLVDFQPSKVAVKGCSQNVGKVAKLALPSAQINNEYTSDSDFVICSKTDGEEIPYQPEALLILGETKPTREYGHVFTSPRRTLIVNRHDLPFEVFDLNF